MDSSQTILNSTEESATNLLFYRQKSLLQWERQTARQLIISGPLPALITDGFYQKNTKQYRRKCS
jgi:hypothetical protein